MTALLYYWNHFSRVVEEFDDAEAAVSHAWYMVDYEGGSPTVVEDLETGEVVNWDDHPHYDHMLEQERLANEARPAVVPAPHQIMLRPPEHAFGTAYGSVVFDYYQDLDKARTDLARLRAKVGDRAYIESK